MSMPKVSVIMGVFNCGRYLRECIDSILAQTYTDWEFVICDDCSTDSTNDILREYKEKYPDKFVILKNEVNSRLAYSLNRCIEAAHGEYMARMDGDDICMPDRFEKQVGFLDTHPEYAVVGTLTTLFDENGDFGIARYPEEPDKYSLKNASPFGHVTIMMRKSAYEKIGAYTVSKQTKRSQDYEMWFRFYAAGFRGYNIQEPLVRVRDDRDAASRRTAQVRINAFRMKIKGYRLLHYPLRYYPYAFVPLLKILIPNEKVYALHKKRNSNS